MNDQQIEDAERHEHLRLFNEHYTDDVVIPGIYQAVLRDYRQGLTELAAKHSVSTIIIKRITRIIQARDFAGLP